MGMFDYIKCEKELPLNEELKKLNADWKNVEFQTKDLENCLLDYVITESGELIEKIKEYERTFYSSEEVKNLKIKPWHFVKESRLVKEYDKKVDFHGKILFYEILEESEAHDLWVDFEAYFIYGKLDKIVLSDFKRVESRKANQKKFEESFEKQKKTFSYRLKKKLDALGWSWICKKIARSLNKVARTLNLLESMIYRFLI